MTNMDDEMGLYPEMTEFARLLASSLLDDRYCGLTRITLIAWDAQSDLDWEGGDHQ